MPYTIRMQRNEALKRLRQNTDALRGMGATSLYLFGSAALDEADQASDIAVRVF